MSNKKIKQAIKIMYGSILEIYAGKRNDPTSMLLKCLPSFIFHFEKIFEMAQKIRIFYL